MPSFKSGDVALPVPASEPSPELSELGQAVLNVGRSLNDGDVVDQNLGAWSGAFREAYGSELRFIASVIGDLQDGLSNGQKAFDTYGEVYSTLKGDIETEQGRWDSALTTYNSEKERIEGEWQDAKNKAAADPESYTVDDASFEAELERIKDDLDTTQEEISATYNGKVTAVDNAAQELADSLSNALSEIVSDEVAATAGDAGGVDRTQLGLDLFGSNDGLLGAQMHWEYANEYAPQAAEELREIMSGSGDLTDVDAARLREWQDKYGDDLQNPFFATAFYTDMDPDEVLGWVANYSQSNFYGEGEEKVEALQHMFGSLGTGLTIASGGEYNSDSPPQVWEAWEKFSENSVDNANSLAEWRSEFNKGLIATGRTDLSNEMGYPISGYSAMTSIMALGNHYNPDIVLGGDFLNGVGGDRASAVGYDIVKFEEEFQRQYGTEPHYASGLFYYAYGEEQGASLDPAYNMMVAMGPDVDGTREFFAQDLDFGPMTTYDNGDEERHMGMAEYLISGRDKLGAPYSPWPAWDGGREIGELLAGAADMPDDPNDIEGRQQAQDVALQYMRGYQSALTEDHDSFWWGNQDLDNGRDVFGANNPGLAEWGGYILDDHLEGLARSMQSDYDVSSTDHEHLHISQSLLSEMQGSRGLFVDMGFDAGPENRPASTVYLADQVARIYEDELEKEFEYGYTNATADEVDALTGKWGNLSYTFTTAPGDATSQAAAAFDERNAQIRKLVAEGTDFIPYGKFINNPIVKEIASDIVDYGVDQASEALFPTDNLDEAEKQRALLEAGGQSRMEQAYINALTQMPVENWTDPRAPFADGDRKLVAPQDHFRITDNNSPWNGSGFDDYETMVQDETIGEFIDYFREDVGHSAYAERYDKIGQHYNDLWTDRKQR